MNILKYIVLSVALTALPYGSRCDAQRLTPQACEQTIVTPSYQGRYLWLPIQESAPEGKVQIIRNGMLLMEQNVRMARERVDYFVALDLQPYQAKGSFKVCVQNVPTGSICFSKLAQNDDPDYAFIDEKYRPLYHHTPRRGWMNDPNGMFYKDGVWHLFYQYNPYGSMWGNMHWGHSTSTDLIRWKDAGVALAPDAWGTMFSGSCVVDTEGTAGFGRGAVIAMYTVSRPTPFGGDVQAQCLAYSTDGGKTFTKYEGNPVLTAEDKDFRDPNMFWNDDINAWNLILAVGQEMRIYSSPNLKDWKEESRFGLGYGNHDGVWECPDLFPLQVDKLTSKQVDKLTSKQVDKLTSKQVDKLNGKQLVNSSTNNSSTITKWVLVCNINPGGPFGGSATQYFVGDFDGHKFTCDSDPQVTKWMDWGKDHYATVSFWGAPQNRRTVIAWMSNWQYANDVPTMQYRSANSIARDLGLFQDGGEWYVSVKPAPEMLAARGKKVKNPTEACEMVVDLKGSATITLANTKGEKVVMTYDDKAHTFSMDRTQSGNVAFSEAFPCTTVAPTHGRIKQLRIFIDRCSIEAFDADGRVAMTNLVFPSEPYSSVKVKGGKAAIYNLLD